MEAPIRKKKPVGSLYLQQRATGALVLLRCSPFSVSLLGLPRTINQPRQQLARIRCDENKTQENSGKTNAGTRTACLEKSGSGDSQRRRWWQRDPHSRYDCVNVSQVLPFAPHGCFSIRYFADLPESRALSCRDLSNGNFILGMRLSYGKEKTKGNNNNNNKKKEDQPTSGLVSCLHVSLVLSWPRVSRLPRSQLFPPNPSGQSQLKEPHRLTQVPPFRHGLVLQKCLLAEHPGTRREGEKNGQGAVQQKTAKQH